MSGGKLFLNVLGVLAAIPLSLVLLCWLICAPLVGSLTSLAQPETIRDMIQSVDYEEILKDAQMEGNAEENKYIEAFLKTESAAELINMYVDDLLAQAEGAQPGTVLNEASIRKLAAKNEAELLELVKLMAADEAPEGMEITDQMAKDLLDQVIDGMVQDTWDKLSTAEELGIASKEVNMALQSIRGGQLILGLVVVAVVLSGLLFVVRLYKMRGFLWLGIIYFLAAALNLTLRQGMPAVTEMVEPGAAEIAALIIPTVSGSLLWGVCILGAVAVLCIVGFVLTRRMVEDME